MDHILHIFLVPVAGYEEPNRYEKNYAQEKRRRNEERHSQRSTEVQRCNAVKLLNEIGRHRCVKAEKSEQDVGECSRDDPVEDFSPDMYVCSGRPAEK